MWYGQRSPFGSMGQGQAPMTPGAGMPPHQGMGPMSMSPQQVGPFQGMPMPPPPQPQGQGQQQPINPMQMGMLSQMLMQRTKQPGMPSPDGTMGAPAAGGLPSPLSPGGQNMTPEQMARLFSMLGPGMLGGAR